jgi:hypothetical protein
LHAALLLLVKADYLLRSAIATATAARWSATTAATTTLALSRRATRSGPSTRCTGCGWSAYWRTIHTVEVRFIVSLFKRAIFFEVFPTLNGDGACIGGRLTLDGFATTLDDRSLIGLFRSCRSGWLWQTKLGALLLQESFAGELDAVAFDPENLHKNLIALAQLVLNFLDAVLGDFADVKQAIRTGEELDEGTELSQANHLA